MGIVLIFFIALLILALVRGVRENKREIERWKKKFQSDFGKCNDRQWKNVEVDVISRYNAMRETKDTIDEQTWSDLDMDRVFCQMAYTKSSLGDDYLYYLLRNPVKKEEILLSREEKISALSEQEDIRIKIQVLCAKMGRMKKYSFADYLDYLMKEEPGRNGKHFCVAILILLALVSMSFNVGLGITVFFGLILYNIVGYFKEKAKLEPYLTSLRYLLKNLEYAKELLEILPEEWKKEKQDLKDILDSMKKIQKNSWLLMSPGRLAGEGLELVLDYIRMCFHIDIIKFNNMLKQLQNYQEEVWRIYEIIGEADACAAISCYREFLPYVSKPKFHREKEIVMEEGYHPLLEKAVSNSLEMRKNVLLTGSNASGKSTFLKTLGINVILSQTIHTCAAEEFSLPFCKLYTSMSLKDNLALKESYYMAEIKAIKRILDAAEGKQVIVCMVDEVLRGTNTMERIAASTQILKSMTERGVLCVAATHDVELTRTLEKEYDNYHFEENMQESDVQFSYRLKRGRAESCNAINLLEKSGYNKALIQNARKMVERFKEQGEWICE